METEKQSTGRRRNLTIAERRLLRRWMVDEGVTAYLGIKPLLVAHGLPALTRQAVDYYRRNFITARTCPTCKRPLPERAKA